jgi:prepilin-type N-terminal cleavage/methylation domain-containing protein
MTDARGFSLIEALFALAILSIGVMLAADLAVHGSSSLAWDNRTTQSTQIASGLMEELSTTFATDPRLTAGAHTQYYNSQGIAVGAPDVYKATWTVKLNDPIGLILSITLNVQWSGSTNAGSWLVTYRGSS